MSTEGSINKRPIVKETKVHKIANGTITKPRKDEAADSMEYTGILLPTMDDGAGPVALGDLWNCRTNTVEGNLFKKSLDPIHLQADPIQTLEYMFQHCKSTKDVTDIMKISAELSLDFAGGAAPIKITGSGSYSTDEVTNFREENIIVSYDALTYQVRVRPSAKDAISEQIIAMLKDKTIIATHYVQAVLVGGHATGSIKYSENISDSKKNITGDFSLKGNIGGVTIDAKAHFEKLDSEKYTDYSTNVQVSAQPRFDKSPTTVEEMFTQVEELDARIERERHFPELDKRDPENPDFVMRVTGVPIRFRLVPISHILELESPIEALYKLLEEDLMADFTSMLFTLRDYANPEYIKTRLTKVQPSIANILLDDMNPLSIEIRAYSVLKADLAKVLRQEAAAIFIKYKIGDQDTSHLTEMVKKYTDEFKTIEVESDLIKFIDKGKQELAAIRASDVDGIVDEEGEPTLRFFSNETDLLDWFNTERTIKILLKTDFSNGSPTGVFLKLYDMSPTLAKYGVEVGIAFPNVSNGEFSLTYKTQFETTVYESKEIRFALEVLAIAVDEGETISKLFYSINAALSGLNLPMHEYLFDVPNLVTVMAQYKGVVVSETYCDLLARLTESFETWNFVFPIQALNTGVEMMRFFRQLRVYIPQRFPDLKHRFLVSRFNNVSDKFYSPLLLVFKDNIFQAVCLDQLDILIMMEQLSKPEPDWTLISFGRMRESCIYTPRADWAISVIQNLILDHQVSLTDPITSPPEFSDNPDEFLPSAIQVTRAAAMRQEPEVLTTVALLALSDPLITEELEVILAQYGWKDNQFSESGWNEIDWKAFYDDMKKFLSGQNPVLLKAVLALDALNKMPMGPEQTGDPKILLMLEDLPLLKDQLAILANPPEYTDDELNDMIDQIIAFILEDPESRVGALVTYKWRGLDIDEVKDYAELRTQVLTYNGMPAKIRRIGIMKLFDKFIADESSRPELFDVFHLMSLIEGMADPVLKSLKHMLLPMCKRYCTRVIEGLTEEEYPRGKRRIEDSLTERQLFKTLGVLSEINNNSKLYLIHQELFNFSTLPAPVNVKTTIEKMTTHQFDNDQLETIWTNPKFLYALRQVAANEGVLETIMIHLIEWTKDQKMSRLTEENLLEVDEYLEEDGKVDERILGDEEIEYPYWIPNDITEKVKALVALRQRPNYLYPKEWTNVETMIEAFQLIFTRQVMPIDFSEVLLKNVETNEDIKAALVEVKALYYWNNTDNLFEFPWSVDTIFDALTALKVKHPDTPVIKTQPHVIHEVDLCPVDKSGTNVKPGLTSAVDEEAGTIIVNSQWKKLVKTGVLRKMSYLHFLQLDSLNPIALTEYDEMDKSATTTLRYLTQQLKMNNGTALKASFFEKYINYPPFGPRPGCIDFGDGIPTRNLGFFLSRGDIQTALFHLTDPAVNHLALMSMAKTPVPLPFLVTSIEQIASPKTGDTLLSTQSILLVPALKEIIVPEMEALVPQPRLFRDPYRFVLTLRIGDTVDEMGRSSLINSHLMKDSTFFASKNDPGSPFGRPLNRAGFLEFSWLSESTCDTVFWKNFVKPEYDGQRKQMILLGLLHGDALTFPSLFEVIRPYISCFMVFWKVSNYNDLKAKKKSLTNIIGTKARVLDIVLYPDPTIVEKVHDQNLIYKQVQGGSQHLVNKAKLQNICSDAIAFTVKSGDEYTDNNANTVISPNSNSIFSSITSGLAGTPKGAKPLSTNDPIKVHPVKPVSTPESINLLKFFEIQTIGNIQDAIKVQKHDEISSPIVNKLVKLFTLILNLNEEQRNFSLLHLTWELDFLSRKSSQEWKDRIEKLRSQIDEKFLLEKNPDVKWVLETQQEIRMSMEKFRRNTMTFQDLWRVMWQLTDTEAMSKARVSLTSIGGDFINAGFPIEMFHPTYTQDHLWGNGAQEVLELIPPTTRILVISAFGLKSSGKSTLLNSLFGQGFTEHGTTYGIQIRVLWLTAELRESLDCDAFIIIDSEGIGGSENKIDEGADTLERKLVTLLLGISSVSLATILGPQMNELKDILEVSMSSLGKVTQVLLIPDVYLVQQYLPEMLNGGTATSEFNNVVQSAIKLTTDLELQVGIQVTEAHRLKQIKSRNKHAEVVHQISSRGSLLNEEDPSYLDYQNDVQSLYEKIIHIAATTRGTRLKFRDWFNKTNTLWQEIHGIKFPFYCPTTLGIRDVVNFDSNIDVVKTAIDAAFFYHEKKAIAILTSGEGEDAESIDDIFEKYEGDFDSKLEARLNTLIGSLQKVINACDDLLTDSGTKSGAQRRRKLRMSMAAEPNPNSCLACLEAFKKREALFAIVLKQPRGFLVEEEVNRYAATVRDSIYERIRQGLIARMISTRQSVHDLREKLDEIRLEFPDEEEVQWSKFLQHASTLQFVIPATHRLHAELKEVYKNALQIVNRHSLDSLNKWELPDLKSMVTFDVQIYNSALDSAMNPRKPEMMTWLQHDWLVSRIGDIPKQMKDDFESVLYRPGMARDLQQRIHQQILRFEEYCGERLLPNFKWEVHFYTIQLFSKFIEEQQDNWDLKVQEPNEDTDEDIVIEGGNPLKVLRKMRGFFTLEDEFFLPINFTP